MGSCFYHPYPFVASDHCMVIWLKERELNRQRLLEENFYLRIDPKGHIAYDHMENFIRALKKQQIEKVKTMWEQRLKAYENVVSGAH
ncbi:hypothetical protein [Helicobacter sp. L8]|uniref:hypothetical protein n=1 Tax=Helicobacter sp. L8 TaxID=2316078 RepID=UPI000EAEDDB4|nr:hypothetical protein [Helicobacter sp. L8]